VIEKWWQEGETLSREGNKLFLMHHMKQPYRLLNSLICILYGKENNTHFKRQWAPLVYYVAEKEHIFNLVQLLSINIFETKKSPYTLKPLGFYMFSYLIDVLCANVHFLGMRWECKPSLFPVHIYFFQI